MATTLVNLTGFQRGVEADETGINIARISTRYFPEYKDKIPNKSGQTRGFAVPDKLSREVSITGEVTGATGLMAATHVAAVTVANDTTEFGALDGTLYMDEATVTQERDGWRSLDIKLSADPENEVV